MFEFLSLKEEYFGLDISDSSLKIVKIRKKKRGPVLDSFGAVALEPGIVEDGVIEQEDALATYIKKIYKNARGRKIRTKYVACSLPENKSFMEVIPMPVMKENEVHAAVMLQAENYIPLPLSEVYLGSEPINKNEKKASHFDTLIVAMPKKIVNAYVNVLKKAGLVPIMMAPESQAIVRSLIKNNSTKPTTAIIDIGREKTIFIVSVGASVRFSSSISFSYELLTKAMSKSLNISPERADSIKGKFIKNLEILKVIDPLLEAFAAEIQKYIFFYEEHGVSEHTESRKIEKIILCGGGAELRRIPKVLRDQLGIPIEWGNPWTNFPKEGMGWKSRKWLPFTTAIGLALPE